MQHVTQDSTKTESEAGNQTADIDGNPVIICDQCGTPHNPDTVDENTTCYCGNWLEGGSR